MSASAFLWVELGVEATGLRVRWRLSGVRLRCGEPLAQLPLLVAGGPTIQLRGADLTAVDDAGPLRLVEVQAEDGDGRGVRRWLVDRDAVGPVRVEYLARPNDAEPLAATPPLELRAEGGGLSGAFKCFLVLPTGPADIDFEVRWQPPPDKDWVVVSSLGEGSGDQALVSGRGLELLGDTYVMCGDLTDRHRRDGPMSVWWLTPPGIDVVAFTDRLAATYRVMCQAFDAPAAPFRVFFRTHPHRGLMASAHPASFVMAVNPDRPLDPSKVYETIAHELVHEWLHLDGPDQQTRWFREGAADYYSLVLPWRAGLLNDDAFVRAVNLEARVGYANPRRHLSMADAEPMFFSDFFAHWLPYARGMFYLADLDARLRTTTSGQRSVDDVVVEVTRRRRDGETIGLREWCTLVDRTLGGSDEQDRLDAMVFTGDARPGPDTFGPRFEMFEDTAPTLDLGFDPLTFATNRVHGLIPGGPADAAGLHEGDQVQLPSFLDLLALTGDDAITVAITHQDHQQTVTIPLGGHTIPVPQWRPSNTQPTANPALGTG